MNKFKWHNAKTTKPLGIWNKQHPNLSEDVLIYNHIISIGRWNRNVSMWEVGEPADKIWIEDITHWMPLPTPPSV